MKKLIISLIILITIVIGIVLIFNKQHKIQKIKSKSTKYSNKSIYPIYDFTKEIAGDKANVSMLLPPGGVEIHDYRSQLLKISYIHTRIFFVFIYR